MWIARVDHLFHTQSTFTGYRQFLKKHKLKQKEASLSPSGTCTWNEPQRSVQAPGFVMGTLWFFLSTILCAYFVFFIYRCLCVQGWSCFCVGMSDSMLDMFRKAGTVGAEAFMCLSKLWVDVAFLSSDWEPVVLSLLQAWKFKGPLLLLFKSMFPEWNMDLTKYSLCGIRVVFVCTWWMYWLGQD